ncbi:MAG: spoIIIJ-associated protein [Flavobacteriaceae bacterium]|jgi:spoIIIJ-associated protein
MIPEEVQKNIEDFFTTLPLETHIEFSYNEQFGSLWCSVTTPDSKILIGRDGENLYYIRYILRRILEAKNPEHVDIYHNIIFDINGYEKERIEKIHSQAHMMAERARFFKSPIECEPMSAFDRRIVHEYLSSAEDLSTESCGEGKDRHIVISFVSK